MRAPSAPQRRLAALGGAVALSTLLVACAVGPDFQRPAPDVPATWSAAPSAGQPSRVTAAPVDPVAWWTSFRDPELTSLVARAAEANLDLRQAALRIAEARTQRDIAAADRWPTLNANAAYQDTRLSDSTPTGALFDKLGSSPALKALGGGIPNPYDQYQAGFDASWEVDLFGRVRRSVEAAKADSAAAIEDGRGVQVSVMGEVGRAYLDLRGAQLRRRITQANIATAQELLTLSAQRRAAGQLGHIDVAGAAAQALSSQAQLPALDQRITQDINQLSLLLAREPGALKAELEAAQPIPPVPPQVPVGLPADLARRRPDIRAAEARLQGATARIGVATADLYPRLTLSAQGGLQAQHPGELALWASRFFVVGPTIELPIFDAGKRRANVRLAGTRAKEAALSYRAVVLGALQEVDNALAAYDADQTRSALLERTVARNREAYDLSRQRWDSGVASWITVLDAERTLQQNQLLQADAQMAVSVDLVAIYKALGGGWS